ncbi:MAG: HAMP domain-containing histidine kinase [Limnohabitans sp.]|nr:MAG: HAMP domain-containing histidine kinase [Limnohabitans sp.]
MLHSQTTLILAAFLFLALPVMVWLALRPASDQAVAWWCAGGLAAGLGIVLMGLRPWLPAVVSYQVANICVLGSMVFWAQSLRTTQGRAWSRGQVLVWLLLGAGFYSALLAWCSPAQRGLWMRLALGLLSLYTAWCAFRLSRQIRSGNAATIAVTYLVLGLTLTLQSALSRESIATPSPFSNTWDASLLALTALVTAMVGHFSYVGMMLDLTANEQIQARLAQQGERQTRLLDLEIRRIERHRRMAILSGSLAHELNQPLTVALMNAQLAERHWAAGAAAKPTFLELLGQVEAGIDRTVQILQRIRMGGEPAWPGLREVDLHQVLEQSLAQVQTDMQRAGVVLQLDRSPVPLRCLGDEVALSQVLVNLLRNAVQAMAGQPRRQLIVLCRADQGQAQVLVCDTGTGLSEELRAHWGEPLRSTRPDGLGMGLAISRDIMARHHGTLSLMDRPEGGVQAQLSLPLLAEAT